MGSVYDARWLCMRTLCEEVNARLANEPDLVLFYRDSPITAKFEISYKDKEIVLRPNQNCTYLIFSGNPEYDDGAYTPVTDLLAKFREDISIYKKIEYLAI